MSREFSINGINICKRSRPYLIAELSANHNGSLDRALKSIQVAKECGADAIKLQTYTADTMTIRSDRPEFQITSGLWKGYDLYSLYEWAHTPFEWHKELFSFAHKIGITIFSSPFDETAVDLLEELNTPAYKIASFEIIDLPLIRYVAKTKKPIIISTGMASINEIEDAVRAAQEGGCSQIALLQCTSSYPAKLVDMNLNQIPTLINKFNRTVGLSDHSLGTTAATAAVALGARIIEKHFTLDKSSSGPDSEFSSDPKELTSLVKTLQEVSESLGGSDFKRPESEFQSMMHRRSLYFINDIDKDQTIQVEDVKRIRPGKGLSPKHFLEIIGKKVNKPVRRGTPVSWDLLSD